MKGKKQATLARNQCNMRIQEETDSSLPTKQNVFSQNVFSEIIGYTIYSTQGNIPWKKSSSQ